MMKTLAVLFMLVLNASMAFPGTNTFTFKFSTPALAGGLAYDPFDDIMWVGMSGGTITPYSLTGVQLGPTIHPFGPGVTNTIDGLAFLGEGTQNVIPEPATMLLLGAGLIGFAGLRRKSIK